MNKESLYFLIPQRLASLAMMAEGVFGKLKNMPAGGVGTAATVVQKGINAR